MRKARRPTKAPPVDVGVRLQQDDETPEAAAAAPDAPKARRSGARADIPPEVIAESNAWLDKYMEGWEAALRDALRDALGLKADAGLKKAHADFKARYGESLIIALPPKVGERADLKAPFGESEHPRGSDGRFRNIKRVSAKARSRAHTRAHVTGSNSRAKPSHKQGVAGIHATWQTYGR